MAVKHETDLYPPIKAYFASRGYEVRAEVRGCDLVALRPDEEMPVIVEMKKTFTLPLLLQGVDRQRTGAAVWLAVERNRTKKGAHNQRFPELAALCGRLGLGLMTVTFYKTKEPVIEVWREPAAVSGRAYALSAGAAGSGVAEAAEAAYAAGYAASAGGRKRAGAKPLLREFAARSGDYNVGGSTGRKLVTAYRERAIQCALALGCRGPLAPREIQALTGVPNAGGLLRDNHYGWFRKPGRGLYELTREGRLGLREFAEVTAVWAAKLEWASGWEERIQGGEEEAR
ncbi:hypothetical protein J19TS2_41790 [Cohnella xylanilytica]|uniref:Uncharacterized protein n=1 Tax=Cohnella xylanilytica TaxID=557555 RepID=A0A841TT60_9BACL|nr:DUF2161 family putative PD-(D/E)XK-type phosphodiesterase [Cohnella xylanilytica]MBB6691647.1 hypothetical protein [Cohnella xylanilytica]GIO14624.1 hypothetical protein J19TS2_41790 [Cohnella xylanilytica]